MILESIELTNFRLHKNTKMKFSEELNYIIGGNGQGKTSILEAIYYLCTTKSFNQSSDGEAVNFNTRFFNTEGVFKDLTSNIAKVNFSLDTNKKSIFIDEKQVYKSSSVIGKFPVVTLIQSDHDITQGSPTDRRKFVDSVISQSSETYLKIYLDYVKTLKQRSSLLSKYKETNNFALLDQLEVWNTTLVNNGSELVKHRIKFIEEFNGYILEAYRKIMENEEVPKISYNFYGVTNPEQVKEKFISELESKRNLELKRATNLIGPHRDEFTFKINNYELRKYGSQGQHKTFQVALRFAQFFYMKEKLNKTPIFLMDDVFGELDSFRAGKISKYLKEVGQAFITMTDFSNYENLVRNENDLLIEVKNGQTEIIS